MLLIQNILSIIHIYFEAYRQYLELFSKLKVKNNIISDSIK